MMIKKKRNTINAGEAGILGYKAFDSDLTCRGFQYEIGKTYELGAEPILCRSGFHFCLEMKNVFNFYEADDETRLCLVRAYGDVLTDGVKCVTGKIEILEEILDTDRDKNQGYWNVGARNCGDGNIGDFNIGCVNRGNQNTGCDNEGVSNVGCKNRGDGNIGTENVGDCNIGVGNVGSGNVGWCNRASDAVGLFNTKPTSVYIFNKPFEGSIAQLREDHAQAIGMLVDIIRYHRSYDDFILRGDMLADLELIEQLPNFDPDIFKELTGLDYNKLKVCCAPPTACRNKKN